MSKQNKNRQRREMVEQMRREAQAKERRRTLAVVAGCIVVALIIVGAAGYKIYQDNQDKNELAKTALTDIGDAAKAAGCGSIQQADASGQGEHTTDPVTYSVNPPPFGAHNPTADPSGKHFFTADDRPPVEVLVHNQEHGWTIVWYDDSISDNSEQMKQLRATADKFDSFGQDPKYNMIIAPWTKDDGDPIPDGKHIALTHWSIHQPTYDPEIFKQQNLQSYGESQYCDTFSGDALDSFMKKFPYDDAPEGNLWHQ